jgi:hypothetical protein
MRSEDKCTDGHIGSGVSASLSVGLTVKPLPASRTAQRRNIFAYYLPKKTHYLAHFLHIYLLAPVYCASRYA